MDLEKMTHTGYRTSVIIAIVLSCMVVTLASLLGRGTLNLRGALLLEEPSDVTVIAAVEPKLSENIAISSIDFLRKEKRGENEKPFYAYQVRTSDGIHYLVRLGFDDDAGMWSLLHFEKLHGGETVTSVSGT
jgi:hypothetical protein